MGINSASLLFKKVFAGKASADNTRAYFEELEYADARLSTFSTNVWSEAHLIPDRGIGAITGSVTPGDFISSGVVKYYSASGFGHIEGTTAGFSSSVKDWIPFNFGDGTSYNYFLLKNDGSRISISDPSNWTFDTEAGVLIFHDGFPTNVSETLPPSMSAYAYVGKKLSDGLTPSINITASNISASGIISADELIVNNLSPVSITTGNITSSGNISASGDITAGSFSFEGFNFIETNTLISSGSTVFGSGSMPSEVTHQFTGSILLTGSILPDINGTIDLGSHTKKFSNLFATNTFFGGVHEINLETEGLDQMQEGTILSLKDGTLHPCEKEADPLVMGIVSSNSNFPIILGAEPILINGKIKEGDYIITSNIKGHGKGINPEYIYNKQLYGKIIAQALEDGDGDSFIIKAMIRKI
jgi:hypothetical protein